MVVIGYAHKPTFHPQANNGHPENMQNDKDNIFATQIKCLNYFK